MPQIIAQPINFSYVGNSHIVPQDLSVEANRIIKISEFGLKYGY